MSDFIRGFGSVFSLFPDDEGIEYVEIPTHSDHEAIHKDIEQVGNDMYKAFDLVVGSIK